jgi:iron-sulfur cluster insertion protein
MSETQAITLTNASLTKIWHLLKEEDDFDLSLRIYVTGGGCSGFQYGFTFEEETQEDDLLMEYPYSHRPSAKTSDEGQVGGEGGEGGEGGGGASVLIRVLVDPMSLQYLEGAVVDYKQDAAGEQFVIRNPNAKTKCGCGSSFSA